MDKQMHLRTLERIRLQASDPTEAIDHLHELCGEHAGLVNDDDLEGVDKVCILSLQFPHLTRGRWKDEPFQNA